MPDVESVELLIVDVEGRPRGTITIENLPGSLRRRLPMPAILDGRGDEPTAGVEPVQLLEQQEYRYRLSQISTLGSFRVEPSELFSPDDATCQVGRLRTSFHVGGLPIIIFSGDAEVGRASVEVRSLKLDYLTDFRWMLRDLAEEWAEVIMQAFAPTQQYFAAAETLDAPTAYQRFAFIQSQLRDEAFTAAIGHILARPHQAWIEEEELSRPQFAGKPNSDLVRQLAAPGPRIPWPSSPIARCPTLPRELTNVQRIETVDTPANRFVKFALLRWRDVAATLADVIVRDPDSYRRRRGTQETQAVLDELDAVLSQELFREVGQLTYFPAGNQVLQKKEGYRDIFRAYVQLEAAARLWWSGGDQVFGAGQRDVAALYEYWAYMQLLSALRLRCDSFESSDLLKVDRRGVGVNLVRGQQSRAVGVAVRLGRPITVELWFNRSFSKDTKPPSWSRPMRPDCSLRLTSGTPQPEFEDVWLHFDAKYRAQDLSALFGPEAELPDDSGDQPSSTARREDLLKMHAYKDAIKRSAGSFVLYPGLDQERRPQFHELIPGLGAFTLRPAETGAAEGGDQLGAFLDDVILHFASVASQERRGRYWQTEVFRTSTVPRLSGDAPISDRPPADTQVLLGYVKNQDHLDWIHRTGRYNVRGDVNRKGSLNIESGELGASLLLLYGKPLASCEVWSIGGPPEIWTKAELADTDYPVPSGKVYLCLRLGHRLGLSVPAEDAVQRARMRKLPVPVHGAPVAVSWADLAFPPAAPAKS